MKKQSGFTLIELLLVLAIISIISAIAIPTFLTQRGRARDKAAMANANTMLMELVAGFDRAREAGTSMNDDKEFTAAVLGTKEAPLVKCYFDAGNPWGTKGHEGAFKDVVKETSQKAEASHKEAKAETMGQVQIGYLPPASGVPGCVVTKVYLNNVTTEAKDHIYTKIAAID